MKQLPVRLAVLAILGVVGCSDSDDRTASPLVSGDPAVAEALNRFVEQTIERHRIPGLALAVVQDGAVVFDGAWGFRDLDTGQPMGTHLVMPFMENSKPFTATAVMQLVEEGKIDLDWPAKRYLPYFEMADPRHEDITVRQLLNHTAGIPDESGFQCDTPEFVAAAPESLVLSLHPRQLDSPPGQRHSYSNTGYDLLAALISEVAGVPFEQYVKERILSPLAMNESTFVYPETKESHRATPHTWQLGPATAELVPYDGRRAGSAMLASNVTDMAHWLMANLGRGEWEGNRILLSRSHARMWVPSAGVDDEAGVAVGLGWFISLHRDERIVFHGGANLGFSSYVVMVPERNLGLVLASNYYQTPHRPIALGILDILAGREPQPARRGIGYEFAEVLPKGGLDAARSRYRELESEHPDLYTFDASQLNTVGYHLLNEAGTVEDALQVFRFNAELYSNEPNVLDSLADAYRRAGDQEQAEASYRLALELDPAFEPSLRGLESLLAPEEPAVSDDAAAPDGKPSLSRSVPSATR